MPAATKPAAGVFFTFQDAFSLGAKLDPVDGYAHVMAGDIAAALTENGWKCRAFPTWTLVNELALFRPGRYAFVMGFNLIPDMDVGTTSRGDTVTFYNMWRRYSRAPVISVLIDQAFHHVGRIRKHMPMGGDMALALLERNDLPYLQNVGVEPGRMVHLPWGGPPPDPNPKPFAKRRYEMVFHGGAPAPKTTAEFRAELLALGASEATADGICRAVDMVVEEGAGVEVAAREGLRSRGIDAGAFNIDQFRKILQMTERQARSVARRRFLAAFADLQVHFFGDFPEDFRRGFPRATFHAGIPFRKIVDLMRDAKLSLCETVCWRENAHLRLTYAVPFGCLPVAEKNDRLARDFMDMENIVFTSHPHAEIADKVRAVLADPRLGQRMIDAARPIYAAKYSWRETVKVLAPFLPPLAPVVAGGKKSRSRKTKSAPKARSRRARRS